MDNNKTKAVIYARYSSHNQREESIEGQLRICHDFASRSGITIINEYIDRAQSATTDKRDAFQKLMRDAKKEQFTVVLVYNLDRFARNRYDSAKYKAHLKKHGITLKSVTQSIPDGPDGIILESVMEGINEYYSANLARNVKRGMTENALNSKVNGLTPYGYRKSESGHYQINEHEAQVVKFCFEQYAAGTPKATIVKELNKQGYRTRLGKAFRDSSLECMLKNRRYMGIYIFGCIEKPGEIPEIIPEQLFNKVQEMLKTKRRAKGHMKAEDEYILSGKLYCGHCNTPMIGESGKSRNGDVYRYYKCGRAKKKAKSCDKKSVRKEAIEQWVIGKLQNEILTDETIHEISEHIFQVYQKDAADHSHLDGLKNQFAENKGKIANILKAIEAGIFTSSTKERLEELEAEGRELEDAIEIEESRQLLITQEMIEDYLLQLRSGAEKSDDYRKALIKTFVDRIYLFDDKGVLIFRTSSDSEPKTIDGSVSDIVGSAQPSYQ